MNRCSSCEGEFGYWEVWRSFWKAGLPRIQCPSCGKKSFPALVGVLLSLVLAFFWVLLSIRTVVYLQVTLILRVLLIPIIGFFLSLPLPLLARYGQERGS